MSNRLDLVEDGPTPWAEEELRKQRSAELLRSLMIQQVLDQIKDFDIIIPHTIYELPTDDVTVYLSQHSSEGEPSDE